MHFQQDVGKYPQPSGKWKKVNGASGSYQGGVVGGGVFKKDNKKGPPPKKNSNMICFFFSIRRIRIHFLMTFLVFFWC